MIEMNKEQLEREVEILRAAILEMASHVLEQRMFPIWVSGNAQNIADFFISQERFIVKNRELGVGE